MVGRVALIGDGLYLLIGGIRERPMPYQLLLPRLRCTMRSGRPAMSAADQLLSASVGQTFESADLKGGVR